VLGTALTGVGVRDDGGLVGIDSDGWLVLSTASGPERVYELPDRCEAVVAQAGERVLVLSRPEDGSVPARYFVVDLATGAVVTTPLTGREALAPALAPDGSLVAPSAADGALRLLATAPGGQVAVGPAVSGPAAVLRRSPGATGFDHLTTLRLELTDVRLAGDVVMRARTVDAGEPWWTAVADDGVRRVAGRALAAGLAALLLTGALVGLSRRRVVVRVSPRRP
jgi:hypothetical protein